MDRRKHLRWLGSMLAATALPWAARVGASESLAIRVNLPGPHSLPFLPLELIRPLGLEREANAHLQLRYFTSGVQALEDMLAGNANFAAHGFSILPGMREKGKEAVAIASLGGTEAALVMLVRSDLAGKIKRVSDLRFHSIGASTGSVNSKTYQQMVAEQMLGQHGIPRNEVRWVPTSQNWESIKSVLISKSVDALFCEEPFATRAAENGLANFLFEAKEHKTHKTLSGSEPLRAVISIASGVGAVSQDDQARTLTSMLQRSLAWIFKATPQAIIDKLDIDNVNERKELLHVLERYRGFFGRDASFSDAAVAATAAFLEAGGAQATTMADLINDRWVGRRA